MVSNLDSIFMIFALCLSSITILIHQQKCLDDTTFNVYKNYDDLCIGNAFIGFIM